MEGRLPVRAEHAVHSLLDPPVHDIGNAKAPFAATRLWNPYPANHPRAIASIKQGPTKRRKKLPEMRAHLVDAPSVWTGRPAVPCHLLECVYQVSMVRHRLHRHRRQG